MVGAQVVWVHPDQHKVVGQCLARLRREAGLTQKDIAGRLRKPQSFVSSYEAGQRRIDVLELLRIAVALEREPVKVFEEIVEAMPDRTAV
ncbi:MAG: helix-turn-helix transcriptional regulator [Magnetospirillum sp.]|nr:helix-turn-helix transcriptional regulator [Magnetospirillum sp.]